MVMKVSCLILVLVFSKHVLDLCTLEEWLPRYVVSSVALLPHTDEEFVLLHGGDAVLEADVVRTDVTARRDRTVSLQKVYM